MAPPIPILSHLPLQAISPRHSTGEFISNLVPQEVHHALILATQLPPPSPPNLTCSHSASASSPAHLSRQAHASSDEEPQIPSLPTYAAPFRSHLGEVSNIRRGVDLPRDDLEARRAVVLQNNEFFGAPVGVIVCAKRPWRGGQLKCGHALCWC